MATAIELISAALAARAVRAIEPPGAFAVKSAISAATSSGAVERVWSGHLSAFHCWQ